MSRLTIADVNESLNAFKKKVESNFRTSNAKLKAIEEKIKEHDEALRKIERDINDTQRQTTKNCIILSGKHLPLPQKDAREDCINLFTQLVKRKYNIDIDANEIAIAHRRKNGTIIAKFIKLGPGSSFDNLRNRRGKGSRNPNKDLQIYANVMLTKTDGKLRFMASCAQKAGEIHFYDVLPSGRIGIRKEEGDSMIPIDSFDDIKPFLTEKTLKLIKNANKDRGANQKKRRAARRNKQDAGSSDESVEDGEKMDTLEALENVLAKD